MKAAIGHRAPTRVRVEVFADVMCPFTHVGLRRLHDARGERGDAIRVRAWPLEWINGAPLGAELVAREVEALRARVAPDLFGGFDAAAFPHTSFPAFGLAAAAYAVDDATGEVVSLALRDALFERGDDISDAGVLGAIGERFDVGLPGRASTESAVRTDWERGKARAVRGSPHFFVGDRGWFCPTLEIHHDGDHFDIRVDRPTMAELYAAAVGPPSA